MSRSASSWVAAIAAFTTAMVVGSGVSGDGWNRELGWGRLDAAAAVELALRTRGAALRAALPA